LLDLHSEERAAERDVRCEDLGQQAFADPAHAGQHGRLQQREHCPPE
jgi:hypothetical protein